MAFSERISVIIDVVTDKANAAMGMFRKEVGDADTHTKKASVGISGSMSKIASATVAGFGVGQMLDFASQALDTGVALEELDAKSATVFGGQLGRMQDWAKANAGAMGETESSAIGAGAAIADLLKPMGFTEQAATDQTIALLDLSGALSAWSGGQKTAAEVSEVLSKAMLGERDGLKSLGISISEAEVSARLLENGQNKLTGAALAQAKALATQQLIMEKSTDAQKAWADGSMDGAKAANESKAAMKAMQENLVRELMPALQSLVPLLSNVVQSLEPLISALDEVLKPVVALSEAVNTIDWSKPFESSSWVEAFGEKMLLANDGLGEFANNTFEARLAATQFREGVDAAAVSTDGMSGDLRKAKDAMDGVATATAAAKREIEGIKGQIDDDQAWLDMLDTLDEYKLKMNDAEVSDRDKVRAGLAVQEELIGRLEAIENLPAEKQTEILTLIDQEKYDEAAWAIGVLTAARNIKINFDVGNMPSLVGSKYAAGTNSARAGIALVGEQGPELVMMGGGEKVLTAGKTAAMMSGGGSGSPTYNITVNAGLGTDGVALGRVLVKAIKDAEGRDGIGWRS